MLVWKIKGKRPSAKGTEIDLTGDEDTDSPLASPSGANKWKFKSDPNDVKQCLQRLEKRSIIEDETRRVFECTICKQVVRQQALSASQGRDDDDFETSQKLLWNYATCTSGTSSAYSFLYATN